MTTDRELLAALAGVFDQVDPVPDYLATAADAAFSWRADDFSLLARQAEPAGMRGGSRSLRFTGSATTMDLHLHLDGRTDLHVLGLIRPARPGSTVVACWPDGSQPTSIDALGWFSAGGLPRGPLRFLVRQPGSPDLTTGWFVG